MSSNPAALPKRDFYFGGTGAAVPVGRNADDTAPQPYAGPYFPGTTMWPFGGYPPFNGAPDVPIGRSADDMEKDIARRLRSHYLPVPTFSDPESCRAAMSILNDKQRAAAATPHLGVVDMVEGRPVRDATERQLEELRQKDRIYSREVTKLEKRVAEAEAQAGALETYAPPPQVDPIALLQEIRRKAELLLGERNAVLGMPGEGGGGRGPLSEEVEEEASRWVSRKLLGQL